MAFPVSDTFLQNSGSSQALATTYSASWTHVVGTMTVPSGTGHVIGSGTADTTMLSRWNADAPGTEQYSQITMSTAQISNGIYAGPACRVQSGASTGYYVQCNGATGENYLTRMNAGTETPLSNNFASGTGFANGDILRLEVTGTGGTVTVTVKKALAASPTSFSTLTTYSDTDANRITTAGYVGITIFSNSSGGGIIDWTADNLSTDTSAAMSGSASTVGRGTATPNTSVAL
jgi:hypothetical protein